MLLPWLLVLPSLTTAVSTLTTTLTKMHNWDDNFEAHLVWNLQEELNGWEAIITFDQPIASITQYMADEVTHSADKKVWTFVNKPHTAIAHTGGSLDFKIGGKFSGSSPPTATAILKNFGDDGFTVPPVPNTDGTKYNYDEVLEKSILFYDAQRSGKLPADNPIPWRADSALHDQGTNGEDLTGGWYDAGDNVKFGFPMAATTTLLGWSLLEYPDAYRASGQLGEMFDCIRWPLEWLLKCHTGENELYVQVGDGGKDHGSWTRPEDMGSDRPAFKITASKPGSDVAAEYAAAMTVGSLVFKDKGFEEYIPWKKRKGVPSKTTLEMGLRINLLLNSVKGVVRPKFPRSYIKTKMTSSEFEDELTWGGAWLHRATGEASYLADAEKHYETGAAWGQSWDEKNAGNMILLYNMTKKDIYKQDLEATFTDWLPGGTGTAALPYSPKGLAFRLQWGSLRYASNMAFMALLTADLGIHPMEYRKWAKSQIGYALGDTGRSFVVGFGVNPPTQPHHRGSSCPMIPAPCSWDQQQQKGPNPHTLYGALVGGPDQNDKYTDVRTDYVSNEVACDYNAGFQGAVAGLKSLHVRHILDR